MPWEPPVGTVELSLWGTPGGTDLSLGASGDDDVSAEILAVCPAPGAAAQVEIRYPVTVAAEAPAPTAAGVVWEAVGRLAVISAVCPAPSAAVVARRFRHELHLRGTPGGTSLHLLSDKPPAATVAALAPAPTAAAELLKGRTASIAAVAAAPTADADLLLARAAHISATCPAPSAAALAIKPTNLHQLRLRGVVGGTALHLGSEVPPDTRVAAVALAPTASGQVLWPRLLAGAALSAAPSASASVRHSWRVSVAAVCQAPRGAASLAYDPNLLSAVVQSARTAWRAGDLLPAGVREPIDESAPLQGALRVDLLEGPARICGVAHAWRGSERLDGSGRSGWRAAAGVSRGAAGSWRDADRVLAAGHVAWHEAAGLRCGVREAFSDLPLTAGGARPAWSDGLTLVRALVDGLRDGVRLDGSLFVAWREAGYCRHYRRAAPPPPHPPPPTWGTRLCLWRPLPGGVLSLGLPICPGGRCRIPIRRIYRVRNSAYLVRLPDRTPLPCTELSVSADADSWCWSLSATLAGRAAYEMVAPASPSYLPREVEAGINDHVWRFLLDAPSGQRRFPGGSAALSGRSRTAWLASPYAVAESGVEANSRTAAQLAEDQLADTGFGLVWDLADWLVPGGLWAWSGTPIDRLVSLVLPVDGCLYSHPTDAQITAYPRYPTPAWDWDGEEIDLSVPSAALLALAKAPDPRPLWNGVWVSGTTAGVLASARVEGTAGDLLAPMVVDALLSDEDGVAARARAVSVLSACGPGLTLTADMPLLRAGQYQGNGCTLARPGLLAEIGGVRGRIRSVRVTARRNDGGLEVIQTLGAERREVEE